MEPAILDVESQLGKKRRIFPQDAIEEEEAAITSSAALQKPLLTPWPLTHQPIGLKQLTETPLIDGALIMTM